MRETDTQRVFEGRRGAVSITFDDGTENQLARAVAPLDERGLRGTFYINPRDTVMTDFADDWRAIARRGHEIGNHTLSHPCPASITGGRGLEDMTLDGMEADVLEADRRLRLIAPEQDAWTFAYPCYATYVGRGPDRQSYVPIVAKHFVAGRAAGEIGFANHPARMDRFALVATPVERLEVEEVLHLIERLSFSGHWLILVFHDIETGVLPVRSDRYLTILDYIATASTEIYVATVGEVIRNVCQ